MYTIKVKYTPFLFVQQYIAIFIAIMLYFCLHLMAIVL